MKTLNLPPKTKSLLTHYQNIKVGQRKVVCPYYQNLRKQTKHPVLSGKGTPSEIEAEIKKLIKIKPSIAKYNYNSTRLALVEADIGIDCSGLVVNLLHQFILDTLKVSLSSMIPPSAFSLPRWLIFKLRPRTNLSAHKLTWPPISEPIDFNQAKPGDLIKVGKGHIAIVTQTTYQKGQIQKIRYAHSTPDYGVNYGVRQGEIVITDSKKSLANQNWTETDENKINWTKKDYLKSKKKFRGIYRLAHLLS
jgi:hypothetical protein